MGILKKLAARFSGRETNQEKLLRLKKEAEKALEDLTCILGEAVAQTSKLSRLKQENEEKLLISSDSNNDNLLNQKVHLEKLFAQESGVEIKVKKVMAELKAKIGRISLALNEFESSSRIESANRIAAEIVKDFGKNFSMNVFLEKCSEESFRIVYNSENQLLIEQKIAEIEGKKP